jgi:hypothetical protein
MGRFLLAACLSAATVTAAGASASTVPSRSCGSLTVGPTALGKGPSSRGASCMLSAFRSCAPAVYELSSFGVDTIGRSTFTIVKHAGGCTVTVSVTFQVVPQPAKPPTFGRCTAIVQAGSDILATGCHGAALAATESLTGRHTG